MPILVHTAYSPDQKNFDPNVQTKSMGYPCDLLALSGDSQLAVPRDRSDPILSFLLQKVVTAESRYSIFGREFLAVNLAVKHFQHFLVGKGFTVFSDHRPLSFALKFGLAQTPRCLRKGGYLHTRRRK
ncbi:unnamed protein product [Schistocephalus solidus]|uniref:RT_RNaseH domain-containing protein n=1 Tax=Schistocephalus solidus TaxID=70667 RepID=A0A183TMA0_SCHSO|nr:unnamed protein product [Schistocephalus solidus]